jgi:hypothetical protein
MIFFWHYLEVKVFPRYVIFLGISLFFLLFFSGDFFIVSLVGVVSHQVFPDRTSYDFARCRPLPWLFWKTVLRKKNIFGWFSKPVSTQYEIRQFFKYLLINYLQKFVTVNLFTSNKLTL